MNGDKIYTRPDGTSFEVWRQTAPIFLNERSTEVRPIGWYWNDCKGNGLPTGGVVHGPFRLHVAAHENATDGRAIAQLMEAARGVIAQLPEHAGGRPEEPGICGKLAALAMAIKAVSTRETEKASTRDVRLEGTVEALQRIRARLLPSAGGGTTAKSRRSLRKVAAIAIAQARRHIETPTTDRNGPRKDKSPEGL